MSFLTRCALPGMLLVTAMALSACTPNVTTTGPPTPAQPETPPPAKPDETPAGPVKLAVLVPQSASQSSAAQLGDALAKAAQMAVNESGDPLLSMQVYDTGGDANKARMQAERALQDGADILIGPLLGSSTRAVAGPAAAAGVKVISFSTDTTVAGDPVYLSGFIPEIAARRVVGFARVRGYSTIGVFHPDTPYGNQALDGARTVAGDGIVASTRYTRTSDGIPPAAKSFASEAIATGAQAILLAESGQALRYVGALMQNYGVSPADVRFLGLGEWNSKATLGEPSLSGGWFAAPDPSAMRAFVERYEVTYGNVPPSLAVLGYDAAKIASQLAAEARLNRTGEPFTTQSITRPQGFTGAVGPIRFGEDGLATRGMAILEVGNGVFQTIDAVPTGVGS